VVKGATLYVFGWAANTAAGVPVQSVTVFVDGNSGNGDVGGGTRGCGECLRQERFHQQRMEFPNIDRQPELGSAHGDGYGSGAVRHGTAGDQDGQHPMKEGVRILERLQ
jgi:hypothetical protein